MCVVIVSLPCALANLWNEQVYAKWPLWISQVFLEEVDLLS